MTLLFELGLVLGVTFVICLLMRALKQPLIVGYILSGIIVGPSALNILNSGHEYELLANLGIVFLLFIVGLSLNPQVIREVGKVSLITGIGQIVFTSIVGYLIAISLGLASIPAMYVAIALTFSSTIIVLKLISDREDLDKLYAKIAIGFLLVQDIVASVILLSVGVFANGGSEVSQEIGVVVVKGFSIILILLYVSGSILPRIIAYMATSQELLFVFSAVWALSLASLFAAIGFSVEIGALVAGVSLASSPFSEEMAARLRPLRDLFILVFFLLLGSKMELSQIGPQLIPAMILSVFVLIGNPLIVILLMNMLGYSKKIGFMAGLTVAQISEFSLILAALGLRIGHLDSQVLSLITLVGLITIAGSTYLILYADSIFVRVSKILDFLMLVHSKTRLSRRDIRKAEMLLIGYDRVGSIFVKALNKLEKPLFVVDYNPDSIERLSELGIESKYGDIADFEFCKSLPIDSLKMIVSTVPDFKTNLEFLRVIRSSGSHAIFIVIAQTVRQASEFYRYGASYVILPHHLGALHAAKIIESNKLEKKLYQELLRRHQATLAKMTAWR